MTTTNQALTAAQIADQALTAASHAVTVAGLALTSSRSKRAPLPILTGDIVADIATLLIHLYELPGGAGTTPGPCTHCASKILNSPIPTISDQRMLIHRPNCDRSVRRS